METGAFWLLNCLPNAVTAVDGLVYDCVTLERVTRQVRKDPLGGEHRFRNQLCGAPFEDSDF